MILEFVFEVDIIWTHFLHILDNVNGNHSFTLFPFYLINIFITKLLEEKPIRERLLFILWQNAACEIKYTVWMQAFFTWRKYTKISEMEIGTLLII